MNIYELRFDNGEHYAEDRIVESKFYETNAEARKAFDAFTWRWWYDENATLTINEYELGTQKRTRIYERLLKNLPSQKAYRAEERRKEEEERRLEEEREQRHRTAVQRSPRVELGDLAALEALRAKLAAI